MASPWAPASLTPKRNLAEQGRSNTIPLPRSHVPRTDSEVQLHEDMVAAEWKELCMFYRVVNGIRERQHVNSDDGVSILPDNSTKSFDSADYEEQRPMDATISPDVSWNDQWVHQTHHVEDNHNFLCQQRAMMLASVADDGWSISGYEEMDSLIPVVEADEAPEDDGVFSMDL